MCVCAAVLNPVVYLDAPSCGWVGGEVGRLRGQDMTKNQSRLLCVYRHYTFSNSHAPVFDKDVDVKAILSFNFGIRQVNHDLCHCFIFRLRFPQIFQERSGMPLTSPQKDSQRASC